MALSILLAGCGNWFVDDSIVQQARANAARPGTSFEQQGVIFESAGDATARNGQLGYSADMYFDAANNFNAAGRRQDVLRVFEKCHPASEASCQSIQNLIIGEWHDAAPAVPRSARAEASMPPSIPSMPSFPQPAQQASTSQQRRTNPVNHCVQIRPARGPNGPDQEMYNACPTDITVAWCTAEIKKDGSLGGSCPSGQATSASEKSFRPGERELLYSLGSQQRVLFTACRGGNGVGHPVQRGGQAYCIEN